MEQSSRNESNGNPLVLSMMDLNNRVQRSNSVPSPRFFAMQVLEKIKNLTSSAELIARKETPKKDEKSNSEALLRRNTKMQKESEQVDKDANQQTASTSDTNGEVQNSDLRVFY